jgi:hypothetical protein
MFSVGDVRLKMVLLSGEKVDVVWFVPWKPYVSASGKVFDLLVLQTRKGGRGGFESDGFHWCSLLPVYCLEAN